MCICRQENCDLEVFENSNKCILHCEKESGWNNTNNNFFWNSIRNILNNCYYNNKNEIEFISIIFPKHEKEIYYSYEKDENGFIIYDNMSDLGTNFYSYLDEENRLNQIFDNLNIRFINCIFLEQLDLKKYDLKNSLSFLNCRFNKSMKIKQVIECIFSFSKCNFINEELDFSNKIFMNNFVLKHSKILNAMFDGSIFKKSFSVHNTIFKECIFTRNRFEEQAIFIGSKYLSKLNFKYCIFVDNVMFQNLNCRMTINLEDSFFYKRTNFLNINTKIENRETARIIKDSFEQQNNIIEANKFYALEMKEREKELEDDLKKGKNFFEWLVFKIHGISSNHSQDWLLSLFWILNITFSLFIIEKSIEIFGLNLVTFIPIITIIILGINTAILNDEKIRTLFLFILSLINFGIFKIISENNTLDCIADKINPFSIMTKGEELNFTTMIYKITIAYLIYQLIVSIRQNTRRK